MMNTRGRTGVRHRRMPVVVALAGVLALGCEVSSDLPGASSDTEPDASSSSGEHEPESSCAEEPACDVESLCEATVCGGKVSSINHFGCARTTCQSDADCPDVERCYPRAMGASCLSSAFDCEPTEQGCQCAATNDCNGVLEAHCLPAEFYPVEGYCDLTAFECPDLQSWHESLRFASFSHDQAGRVQLAERLSSCSASVVDARFECGESPCTLGCQLSACEDVAMDECLAACEASTVEPSDLRALVTELAALPETTCACELCGEDDACAATWGC